MLTLPHDFPQKNPLKDSENWTLFQRTILGFFIAQNPCFLIIRLSGSYTRMSKSKINLITFLRRTYLAYVNQILQKKIMQNSVQQIWLNCTHCVYKLTPLRTYLMSVNQNFDILSLVRSWLIQGKGNHFRWHTTLHRTYAQHKIANFETWSCGHASLMKTQLWLSLKTSFS